MSTSKLTEGDLTPLPLDIMGRQTTKEQWERYEMALRNHKARILNKQQFLDGVLDYAQTHGIELARKHFTAELDQSLSLHRPNPPDYIHANND